MIHTVAPVFAQHTESDVWRLLADCYRNSLALRRRANAARSIAFPSLGTGVYGIPIERACVRCGRCRAFSIFEERRAAERIVFCCFSQGDAEYYLAALGSRNTP